MEIVNFEWTVQLGHIIMAVSLFGGVIGTICKLGVQIRKEHEDVKIRIAEIFAALELSRQSTDSSRDHFKQRHTELTSRLDSMELRITQVTGLLMDKK